MGDDSDDINPPGPWVELAVLYSVVNGLICIAFVCQLWWHRHDPHLTRFSKPIQWWFWRLGLLISVIQAPFDADPWNGLALYPTSMRPVTLYLVLWCSIVFACAFAICLYYTGIWLDRQLKTVTEEPNVSPVGTNGGAFPVPPTQTGVRVGGSGGGGGGGIGIGIGAAAPSTPAGTWNGAVSGSAIDSGSSDDAPTGMRSGVLKLQFGCLVMVMVCHFTAMVLDTIETGNKDVVWWLTALTVPFNATSAITSIWTAMHLTRVLFDAALVYNRRRRESQGVPSYAYAPASESYGCDVGCARFWSLLFFGSAAAPAPPLPVGAADFNSSGTDDRFIRVERGVRSFVRLAFAFVLLQMISFIGTMGSTADQITRQRERDERVANGTPRPGDDKKVRMYSFGTNDQLNEFDAGLLVYWVVILTYQVIILWYSWTSPPAQPYAHASNQVELLPKPPRALPLAAAAPVVGGQPPSPVTGPPAVLVRVGSTRTTTGRPGAAGAAAGARVSGVSDAAAGGDADAFDSAPVTRLATGTSVPLPSDFLIVVNSHTSAATALALNVPNSALAVGAAAPAGPGGALLIESSQTAPRAAATSAAGASIDSGAVGISISRSAAVSSHISGAGAGAAPPPSKYSVHAVPPPLPTRQLPPINR